MFHCYLYTVPVAWADIIWKTMARKRARPKMMTGLDIVIEGGNELN